jgi:ABC-type glycerol-3-phosphate transport system substrate-binding protein
MAVSICGGAAMSEALTLKYLCANENFPDSFKEFIADYEAATGNKVEVQLFPAVEYDQMIRARMMAGQDFDLYRNDGIRSAEYSWPADWPADLANRPWASRMSDACKSIISWSDGSIVSIPITNNGAFGIMYNKKIFADAGITKLPATWPEFLEVCAKIKAFGIIPVNIQLASGSEFGTTHLMHQLFCNINKTRGVAATQQLQIELDARRVKYADIPEFLTALTQMVELREKGFINEDFITNSFEMTQEKFGTGKVAMHPCGDFILAPLSAYDMDFDRDIGFFPAPYMDTAGTMASYAGVGLSVNAKSKQLDAALEFMDMFATKDAQDKYMVTNPGMAAFSDVVAESSPLSRAVEEYGKAGFVFPCIDETQRAWPEMEARTIMQELMLGSITPKQMLERIDQQADIIAVARGTAVEGQ